MGRGAVVSLLLLMLTLPAALPAKEKAKPVDMKNVKTVFIGWVGVNPTITTCRAIRRRKIGST